jgi:hypothetical protein
MLNKNINAYNKANNIEYRKKQQEKEIKANL